MIAPAQRGVTTGGRPMSGRSIMAEILLMSFERPIEQVEPPT